MTLRDLIFLSTICIWKSASTVVNVSYYHVCIAAVLGFCMNILTIHQSKLLTVREIKRNRDIDGYLKLNEVCRFYDIDNMHDILFTFGENILHFLCLFMSTVRKERFRVRQYDRNILYIDN